MSTTKPRPAHGVNHDVDNASASRYVMAARRGALYARLAAGSYVQARAQPRVPDAFSAASATLLPDMHDAAPDADAMPRRAYVTPSPRCCRYALICAMLDASHPCCLRVA